MDVNNDMLLDGFIVQGSGENAFRDALNDMHGRTELVKTKSKDIIMLSLCRIPKLQREGYGCFNILSDSSVEDFIENGDRMKITYIPIDRIGEDLFEEMKEKSCLMMERKGELYVVGEDSFLTLCQQAAVNGKKIKKDANIVRDMHLARGLFTNSKGVTLLTRNDGRKTGKVFAVCAYSHTHPADPLLLEALDNLEISSRIIDATGTSSLDIPYFRITNRDVEVIIRLGNSSWINPGIMLCDSDTGYSSLTVRQVWIDNDGGYVIGDESLMRHWDSNTRNADAFRLLMMNALDEIISSDFADMYLSAMKNPEYVNIKAFAADLCRGYCTQPIVNSLSESLSANAGEEEEAPAGTLIAESLKALNLLEINRAKITGMRKTCYDLIVQMAVAASKRAVA